MLVSGYHYQVLSHDTWPLSEISGNRNRSKTLRRKGLSFVKSRKMHFGQNQTVSKVETDYDDILTKQKAKFLNKGIIGSERWGRRRLSNLISRKSRRETTLDWPGQMLFKAGALEAAHKCLEEMEFKEHLSEESKNVLCAFVFKDIFGGDFIFMGPFGKNRVTYLDYIASGKPLRCFEQYIRDNVLPTYSNTHTEINYNAQQTSRLREEARVIIRECVNANSDDAVIFTGSGSTAAVNKLIFALNLGSSVRSLAPIVFVGPYEHHSNILPWREIKAIVITIQQTDEGLIDLQHLEAELKKCRCLPKRMLIGSFSAASNVTGILTDVNSVACLMHSYGGYAFFDYACAAPYTDIDMNPTIPMAYKDAIFISPHKFIGGPQTPGVLVAKKWVFRNPTPHGVGGGTVVYVRRTRHAYSSDILHREEGGTPAIVESVRAGLVFKLKAAFTSQFIMERELQMTKLATDKLSQLPGLVILGNLAAERLPIFSMLFFNSDTGRFLHHDFIALIFNDVFGIQVRSGCACAGPYASDLLGVTEEASDKFEKMISLPMKTRHKSHVQGDEKPHPDTPTHSHHVTPQNLVFKPGFVRVSFPYFISKECFNFVLQAIRMTSEKGWLLLPLYEYNRNSGRWWYKYQTEFSQKNSLQEIQFKTGKFEVCKNSQTPAQSHQKSSASEKPSHKKSYSSYEDSAVDSQSFSSVASHSHHHHHALAYQAILSRAENIFAEAGKPGLFDVADDDEKKFSEPDEALRWFMLPREAADIVNGRQVTRCENLPFTPGRNPRELHPKEHACCSWFRIIFMVIIIIILLNALILTIILLLTDSKRAVSYTNDTSTETPNRHIFEMF